MSNSTLPAASVIDVETTGFYRKSRILEIAVVSLAPGTWETIDEYDTLINPCCDVGPIGVHGISPSMVELAPIFNDVIAAIGRRIKDSVLIAHNVSFDRRMLEQEFKRSGVEIFSGDGMCTFRATRQKLHSACDQHSIPLLHQHRALADARATAELARKLWLDGDMRPASTAMKVGHVPHPPRQHTLRRGLSDAGTSNMHRIVSLASYPHSDEAICQYLDALDWVLDDGIINEEERLEINELAKELGISSDRRLAAHQKYFDRIVAAAKRDGMITENEFRLISQIAEQLEIPEERLPGPSSLPTAEKTMPGDYVCFTGEVVIDGKELDRFELEAIARKRGMIPVNNVTKKNCTLLVAADPASASGKARKARKYGVPILSAEDFLRDNGFSDGSPESN